MPDHTTVANIFIPAGTLSTAPTNRNVNLGLSIVRSILCVVPPGPAGLVGFAISAGGQQQYPLPPGTFFIFDDYVYEQEISNQIDSGQWSIQTYNTDTFPHVLRFYFHWDDVVQPQSLGFSLPVSL